MANSKTDKQDQPPQGNKQLGQAQGNRQQAAGQGGQKSGGMGGPGGGPLNDVGTAQSGMTGGSGMGGNDRGSRQGGDEPELKDVDPGYDPQAGNLGSQETSEVQQSAQREGMGSHRHSNRGNEQAIDATADVDDLGNHIRGAANSQADKKGS